MLQNFQTSLGSQARPCLRHLKRKLTQDTSITRVDFQMRCFMQSPPTPGTRRRSNQTLAGNHMIKIRELFRVLFNSKTLGVLPCFLYNVFTKMEQDACHTIVQAGLQLTIQPRRVMTWWQSSCLTLPVLGVSHLPGTEQIDPGLSSRCTYKTCDLEQITEPFCA